MGDISCPHVPHGRVSWPRDYDGTLHASVYTCRDVQCISRASAVVESITGHSGSFYGFEELMCA